jgi:hypothetical protein
MNKPNLFFVINLILLEIATVCGLFALAWYAAGILPY